MSGTHTPTRSNQKRERQHRDRSLLLLCGVPAPVDWTSDIGGYAGGGGGPKGLGFNHDIRSPAYLQLLTRWFQFGVLVRSDYYYHLIRLSHHLFLLAPEVLETQTCFAASSSSIAWLACCRASESHAASLILLQWLRERKKSECGSWSDIDVCPLVWSVVSAVSIARPSPP